MNKPAIFNKKRKIVPLVPLFYTNIELEKELILNDNKNKSGIYKWVNILTGDYYIGSAVNLSGRFLYYLNIKYMSKYKNKSIIYSSLLKDGYKVFHLEIL